MQHFKLNYIACGAIVLALGNSLIGCSDDDQGSKINSNPTGSGGTTGNSGGTTGSGGNNGTGGNIGPVSGGTNSGGATGKGGSGNVNACPGVPIQEPDGTGGSKAGGQGGDDGLGGAGGEDSGSGGTGGSGSAGKGNGGSGGSACAGIDLEVESVDVDMYIMMDRSVSLDIMVEGTGMTRWEALTAAMQAFVEHPDAAGIGAGLGFFGRSGQSDNNLDCNPQNYADPDVPVALISQNGDDLVTAMEDQFPSGLTPTYPALQGAIQYAVENSLNRPGRAPIVVLVSDGFPTQCTEGQNDPISPLADVAQAGYEGTPSVRTYVIGIEAGFNLQSIAISGGTNTPFLVDEGNIADSFVQTMLNITDSKLGCTYNIPDSPDPDLQIDTDKVSIIYDPPVGSREEIPRVNNLADCGSAPNGGWYYDDPSNPTKILVCPCSCARLQAGGVQIRYGCEPLIGIQ